MRNRHVCASLGLAVVAGLLTGSDKPPAERIVGEWRIDREDFFKSRTKDASEAEAAAFRKALTDAGFDLRFRFAADGTLEFTKTMQKDKPVSLKATWSILESNDQKTVVELQSKKKDRTTREKISIQFLDEDRLRIVDNIDLHGLYLRVKPDEKPGN